MNYADFLFGIDKDLVNRLALVDADSGKRFTYNELQAAVRACAEWLSGLGCQPGQIWATHLYNSAEAVIAHLAIQFIGGISCLLDPLIPAHSLDYYLQDTQANGLLTHLMPETLKGLIPDGVKCLTTADIARHSAPELAGSLHARPYPSDPHGLAAIFYTSGTTNQPKGVMLAPKNFFAHYRIFTRGCYTYAPEDRLLCFVPFSHGYGSKSIFLPCQQAGAAIVMMRSFQPLKVADVVQRESITHVFGVPSHYQQLLRREEFLRPMRGLKAAFVAAALLKVETAQEWLDRVGFPLDEGYGLIETCTGVAFRRSRLPDCPGHIGPYPADLVEIAVVDENFHHLPVEARGEIVVHGENVMLGYLNKPEETARVLQNGWFRTGDMGYINENNEVVLVGRIKDVINVAGIKVAPFEIEAALNAHPDVSESAVVGVEDEMYGEVVKAYVQLSPGCQPEERELIRFLQKKLMNFQVPKSIVFVEDFPRNNIGKIDKKALKDL